MKTAHLHGFEYESSAGFLKCWLEYEPADTSVGYNGSTYLVHAMVDYMDIVDLLSDDVRAKIEEEAYYYFSGE